MWGGGGHYDQWATFLERWGAGERLDPAALPPLAADTLTGDAWERLTNRITGALGQRLRAWGEALTRGIADARDEFGIARALGHARWGLRPIRALAAYEGLPAELREKLVEAVDQQVHSAQRSLEEQVDAMRRAGAAHDQVEARLRTIRDHALTVVTQERPEDTTPGGAIAWAVDPSLPTRRRVVLD